jgi:CRISPR/Cas system-associated exonuclease Cas4 (RecB family)
MWQMVKQSKVTQIYDDYVAHLNAKKSQRYDGKEEWFHSSSAGLCARKHYYSSVEKIKQAPKDVGTMRLFRLGDVIHSDIQDAVQWYASNNGSRIFIEKELYLDDLNVRGFIDLVMVDDGVLYDIKSCNYWKWRTVFGKTHYDPNSVKNYMMQTATYAHWYNIHFQADYPKLESMALLFYNKNDSKMQELKIPMSMIDEVVDYWQRVNDAVKVGAPPIELGFAPVQEWECKDKYCSYFEACGGGLLGN